MGFDVGEATVERMLLLYEPLLVTSGTRGAREAMGGKGGRVGHGVGERGDLFQLSPATGVRQ